MQKINTFLAFGHQAEDAFNFMQPFSKIRRPATSDVTATPGQTQQARS